MDADHRHQLALAAKRLHSRGEAQVHGVAATLSWCRPATGSAALCVELQLRWKTRRALPTREIEAWLEEAFGSHQRPHVELVRSRCEATARLRLDATGRAMLHGKRRAA